MDVVNTNKLKNKLQTRKRNPGQLNSLTYDQGTIDPGENSGVDDGGQRFKQVNNSNSRGDP